MQDSVHRGVETLKSLKVNESASRALKQNLHLRAESFRVNVSLLIIYCHDFP